LVRVERGRAGAQRAIFFAHADGDLHDLLDLRGRRLALVSRQSTGGGVFPVDALLRAGLIPGHDVDLDWCGSERQVVRAVQSGAADAGACYDDCRTDVATAAVAETRIIGRTDAMPPAVIAVRRDLPDALKARLRAALWSAGSQPALLAHLGAGEAPIVAIAPTSENALADLGPRLARVERALALADRLARAAAGEAEPTADDEPPALWLPPGELLTDEPPPEGIASEPSPR